MRVDGFLRNYAVCAVLSSILFILTFSARGMPFGMAFIMGVASGCTMGVVMALVVASTQDRLATGLDRLIRLFSRGRKRAIGRGSADTIAGPPED